jgi:hypothetical protein
MGNKNSTSSAYSQVPIENATEMVDQKEIALKIKEQDLIKINE